MSEIADIAAKSLWYTVSIVFWFAVVICVAQGVVCFKEGHTMPEQEQVARPLTQLEQQRHDMEKNLVGREFLGFTYDEHCNISGMRLGPRGGSAEKVFQYGIAVDTKIFLKEIE